MDAKVFKNATTLKVANRTLIALDRFLREALTSPEEALPDPQERLAVQKLAELVGACAASASRIGKGDTVELPAHDDVPVQRARVLEFVADDEAFVVILPAYRTEEDDDDPVLVSLEGAVKVWV